MLNPYDQSVYDAGYKYIPQSKYLLNPFQIPQGDGDDATTDPGLPSINMGGGGGGMGYTGGITDLTRNFQKAVDARTQRLEDAYDNPSTAKIFGMPAFRQDVNPADAGFYVADPDLRVPQQRTMLGKMFQPQSPQEIMEEGYEPMTNIGILSAILSKADKFGTLPRPDQAFITSQMGYTGPTVFGENTTGGSKDPFGLNVRSGFGNYAERVGKEVDKLGLALSDAGKVGSKYNATFNPKTGLFEGEDAELANQMTKMLRTKLNFYRGKKQERDDFRDQEAQKIQDEIKAAAAAKDRAAALEAIKKQGELSYSPSIHGATDYGRDSSGRQSFDSNMGFGIGSDGGPVSNRTGRGRQGYMLGGLTDLVDIYD